MRHDHALEDEKTEYEVDNTPERYTPPCAPVRAEDDQAIFRDLAFISILKARSAFRDPLEAGDF
jgi:hypothetical protein